MGTPPPASALMEFEYVKHSLNIKLSFSSALSDLVHFSVFSILVSELQSHSLVALVLISECGPQLNPGTCQKQILRPQTRPSELETCVWGGVTLCLNEPSDYADTYSSGRTIAFARGI